MITLSAEPGAVRPPVVRADVGRVSVGREERTIAVPTLEVERAGNDAAPR